MQSQGLKRFETCYIDKFACLWSNTVGGWQKRLRKTAAVTPSSVMSALLPHSSAAQSSVHMTVLVSALGKMLQSWHKHQLLCEGWYIMRREFHFNITFVKIQF